MEALPISTPQLPAPPAAAAGADGAAEAGAATGQQDGDFQAMLLKSLAGLAQSAKGAAGKPAKPVEAEDGGATTDAATAEHPEDLLAASASALAMLAGLPQAAVRPEPGAAQPAAGSNAERAAGERPAIAGLRADEPARAGAKAARPGPDDLAAALKADPEKAAERLAQRVEPLPDFNQAATAQNAQAAIPAAQAPVAQLGSDPAAAAPAPAAPRVETPLGAPGWSTALADRLLMFVGDKQQVAELHINPPHLGPVEIRLTVGDDQASAVFASPHAIVRETIESALPRLREVLAENGINLGQASVTADSPRDRSAQEQSLPSFGGGGERGRAADTPIGAASAAAVRRVRSLVDLFA